MQRRVPLVILLIPLCGLCWYGMMAVHEFGHVLHAWLSGATVTKVVLHPFDISRTDVSPNPRPAFVAWGGFVWGSALPALALVVALRWMKPALFHVSFFAGFCLIANGGYCAAGSVFAAGDTQTLRSLGTSAAVLIVVGVPIAAAGLYIWHRLDAAIASRRCSTHATMQHLLALIVLFVATTLATVAIEAGSPPLP